MAANGLCCLLVLTFSVYTSLLEARHHAKLFVRRLLRHYGRKPVLWSPERHDGGHGFHLNLLIGSRVPVARLREQWPYGRFSVTRIGPFPDPPTGARHALDYVAKQWAHDWWPRGMRRYEVTRGFQPQRLLGTAATFDEARTAATLALGSDAVPYASWLQGSGTTRPPVCFIQSRRGQPAKRLRPSR